MIGTKKFGNLEIGEYLYFIQIGLNTTGILGINQDQIKNIENFENPKLQGKWLKITLYQQSDKVKFITKDQRQEAWPTWELICPKDLNMCHAADGSKVMSPSKDVLIKWMHK